MKVAAFDRYGPPEVVKIVTRPDPVPGRAQIRVRVVSTTVTAGEARIRGWNIPSLIFSIPARLMMGVLRPRRRVLGVECSGVVDAVGEGATRFKVGDEVIACPEFKGGAHAELLVIDEDACVVPKPAGVSFDEAAGVSFGGFTALYFLEERARVRPGQRVLVYGASGSVGLAGVQVAKALGAHVTGVCSGENMELVRSVGADEVIDYTMHDVTGLGETYDVIFETVGKISFGRCRPILREGGRFVVAVMTARELAQMAYTPLVGKRRVIGGVGVASRKKLERLAGMLEAGTMRTVIDSTYPLDEIVEAYRRVETGHKRGSVVIRVSEAGGAR